MEVNFDNVTLTSNYFYFSNTTNRGLIDREAFSFFYFMFYQSRLARGAYSDSQRLLYASTHDPQYARSFIWANSLGIISTFSILFGIDIAIWIFYWIYSAGKKGKKLFQKRRIKLK